MTLTAYMSSRNAWRWPLYMTSTVSESGILNLHRIGGSARDLSEVVTTPCQKFTPGVQPRSPVATHQIPKTSSDPTCFSTPRRSPDDHNEYIFIASRSSHTSRARACPMPPAAALRVIPSPRPRAPRQCSRTRSLSAPAPAESLAAQLRTRCVAVSLPAPPCLQ